MAEHASERARLAPLLEAHLAQRRWMLGDRLTDPGFRVGAASPIAHRAGIDLSAHPAITQWAWLENLPACMRPFEGL